MRVASVAVGGIIVAVGLALIVGHGTVLGFNAIQAAAGACPMINGTGNFSLCPVYTYYGLGLIVIVFGLPILISGLVAPSMAGMARAMGLPNLQSMQPTMPQASGAAPALSGPARFCPACGQQNTVEAAFCSRCGKPMPPPMDRVQG